MLRKVGQTKIKQITTADKGVWALFLGAVEQEDDSKKAVAWVRRVSLWCLLEAPNGVTGVGGMVPVNCDRENQGLVCEEMDHFYGYLHARTVNYARKVAACTLRKKGFEIDIPDVKEMEP